MAKFSISSVGSSLWSLVAPKTPRGRVRQATFFVLVLMVFAGNLAQPKYWDMKADYLNEKLATSGAPEWARMPHFWNVPFRLGLDLQGGTHLVYVADMSSVDSSEQAEAMAGVRDVIERRVNAFGVSEPIVQVNRSGDAWRLIVDLAGVKDISQAIALIGETPILEFKEQNDQPAREMTAEEKKDLEAFNAKALADAKAQLAEARKGNGAFVDLGFQRADGMYADAIDKIETRKLAAGQVLTDLVTLADGHHVVKFEEKRENGKEVQASHILVSWKGAAAGASERSKEEAKVLIDAIKTEATPSNFGSLAKEKSEDTGSGANGGDLGWFGEGAMVKPFQDAAFALEKGKISDVVESEFGYHLIYKLDERPVTEYRLAHLFAKTKTAADILPPADAWKNTQLSGKHLKRATVVFTQQTNEPQVQIQFNDEGKELFAQITERNVQKPVAIFLDGNVLSAPNVQEAIREGTAVISGNFTIKEAKELVRRMNAGALPVPIMLESQQSVGASLGQESLNNSLRDGLLGFAVVALFMILYYRLPGLVAVVALVLYAGLNLALFKLIPVTLTLSGIAGLILSVGMAVDANVLIFERMKEELLRGRSISGSIDEGFARAWNSIRDSNFTTLISCVILFYTSSSLIKGFALTLAIGVVVSMFSAITVSRTLLRLVSGWRWARPTWLWLSGLAVAPKSDKNA